TAIQEAGGQAGLSKTNRTAIEDDLRAFGKDVESQNKRSIEVGKEQRRVAELRREGAIDTVTSEFADTLIAGELLDIDAAVERIAALPGVSRAKATDMATEAEFAARDKASERRREMRSVGAGVAQGELLVDAEIEALKKEFPGVEISRNDVRRWLNETAIYDPFSDILGYPQFLRVTGKTDASDLVKQRRAHKLAYATLDRVETAFYGLRDAAREKGVLDVRAGPFFTEDTQRFLETIGFQSPEVAAYRTVRFEYVSALLKAMQGARPSDFDLRMYLALLPFASEILSGAADAKLGNMRESMLAQIR
ncbi:unnamed protein product, partial [marine sediment metagenome]